MPILGSAGFVPDSFRNGNQFTLRIDHELRPGKDRLYGNLYRTTPAPSTAASARTSTGPPTSSPGSAA
jgi:hypothetical protein